MGKSVSKNAVFSMINRGISVVFPLITVSYISRVLGASGIGEVSSAQNFVAYFSMGAALGIPSYGVRAIAQVKDERNRCDRVFTELFLINLVTTLTAVGLYFFALLFLKVNVLNPTLSLIFSTTIICNIINIEWVYQGFEEYRYIAVRSLLIKIVSVAGLLVFVRKSSDLVSYALIVCFGSVGNYLLNTLNLRKYVRLNFHNLKIKRHLVPILTFFVSVIAIEIYSLLDVTMLTSMTNSVCVGYYSNSTKIIKTAANTLTAISAVLMPRFSYLFAVHDYKKISGLSKYFLNITFYVSIPSCVGIFLLSDQVVNVLFGAGFEPAIATIKILSILIVLMPLSGGVFCQLLLTSGREKTYFICVLLGTVVNAILNYFLIQEYQQNGAALASVFAEMTVSLAMMFFARRIVEIKLIKRDVVSILCGTGIMGGILILLKKMLLNHSAIITLIVEVVVSVVVYFGITLALKNNTIVNALQKIVAKCHIKHTS